MLLGMIGLGRMGANMVRRLAHGGPECAEGRHRIVEFRVATDAKKWRAPLRGAFSEQRISSPAYSTSALSYPMGDEHNTRNPIR